MIDSGVTPQTLQTYTSLDMERLLWGDVLKAWQIYQEMSGADGRIWKVLAPDGRHPFTTRDQMSRGGSKREPYSLPDPKTGAPGQWTPDRSHLPKERRYYVAFTPYEHMIPTGCRAFEVEVEMNGDPLEFIRLMGGRPFPPDDPMTPARALVGSEMVVNRFRLLRERPEMIPQQWHAIQAVFLTLRHRAAKMSALPRYTLEELHRLTAEMLDLQRLPVSNHMPITLDITVVIFLRHLMQEYNRESPFHLATILFRPTAMQAQTNLMMFVRLYCGLLAMEGVPFQPHSDGAERHARLLEEVRSEWHRITRVG